MSFNSRHITPENYEEYLLLYVDNELTAAEKEMVDAFLIVHPELQIELDMLMSTRLPVLATRLRVARTVLIATDVPSS